MSTAMYILSVSPLYTLNWDIYPGFDTFTERSVINCSYLGLIGWELGGDVAAQVLPFFVHSMTLSIIKFSC